MSWTLTTSGAALAKCGRNATISQANLVIYSDLAEGVINTATRKDCVTDYSTVTANFKPVLSDTASSLIAMDIINYDMSGFSSSSEALTMINVLRDRVVRNLEILKDEKNKEVMD